MKGFETIPVPARRRDTGGMDNSGERENALLGAGGFLRRSLREGVFGLQDGLVSTLGALTGIAGGTQSREHVLLAGAVVVAVEAMSMAAGSYLSSKSERQYLERMLREEELAIERDPEGERREIRSL